MGADEDGHGAVDDQVQNEVGADNITPQAIAEKAKAFKGPQVFGAP